MVLSVYYFSCAIVSVDGVHFDGINIVVVVVVNVVVIIVDVVGVLF